MQLRPVNYFRNILIQEYNAQKYGLGAETLHSGSISILTGVEFGDQDLPNVLVCLGI